MARQIRVGIATQIRSMREQRGWSQAELGQKCDMAQESISRLEDPKCTTDPTLRSLKRIAAAFDCAFVTRFVPWSYLLTGAPFDWTAPVPSWEEEFGD